MTDQSDLEKAAEESGQEMFQSPRDLLVHKIGFLAGTKYVQAKILKDKKDHSAYLKELALQDLKRRRVGWMK